MAKRIVKWSLDGSILKLAKQIGENETAVIEAEFDVSKLYELYEEFNDCQKQIIIYAVKQKLMDSGASAVGEFEGKVLAAKEKWNDLLAGKWTGDRVNATGAAENKRVAAEAKDIAKVVSLEGLIVKKQLYPSTFTAEDQAKLDEFLAMVASR
jgi:hypothetical protein